jgi:hypothetical protein
MFQGCINIDIDDGYTLSINAYAPYCCSCMFMYCRNALHTMPDFGGGTGDLSEGCFNSMFEGCESLSLNGLEVALPSDTLAPGCCSRMFANCISLEESPILCMTQTAVLEHNCFMEMFNGCSNLRKITMLGNVFDYTVDPRDYLFEWAAGVSEQGELVVSSEGSVYAMIRGNADYTILPENWDLISF